jgi:hypothetical protein
VDVCDGQTYATTMAHRGPTNSPARYPPHLLGTIFAASWEFIGTSSPAATLEGARQHSESYPTAAGFILFFTLRLLTLGRRRGVGPAVGLLI